ncbi:hypothetical protein C1707_21505 [Caulobacter flavus]|nr:hypothetical protein C1707_21505 [Caulobacter flavus]
MAPGDYLQMAQAYCEAAEALALARQAHEAPLYMLSAHAIELALKSVLLSQGDDVEALMAFGHSLDACRQRAVRHGFGAAAAPSIAAGVQAVAMAHHAQAFRYPQALDWEPPPVEDLVTIARRVVLAAQNYLAERAA